MSRNHAAKIAARRRQAETGESYQAALEAIRRQAPAPTCRDRAEQAMARTRDVWTAWPSEWHSVADDLYHHVGHLVGLEQAMSQVTAIPVPEDLAVAIDQAYQERGRDQAARAIEHRWCEFVASYASHAQRALSALATGEPPDSLPRPAFGTMPEGALLPDQLAAARPELDLTGINRALATELSVHAGDREVRAVANDATRCGVRTLVVYADAVADLLAELATTDQPQPTPAG